LNFYYNSRAAKVSVLTVFRLSRPSDGIKLRERSRLNFDFGRLAKISLSKTKFAPAERHQISIEQLPAPFGRTLTKRS
jgi:hypothetical protein